MTQTSFEMITSAVSDRGLSEKRPQNEDSYLEMPEVGLFAVADGVGGAQAGDVASQMAMEVLAEAFNNLPEGGDVEELMNIAISRGNGAIFQMSRDLPQLSTMATTIVALQINGNIATIGHVGDSRLYRLDARGNLFRETQDHSVVEEEVRAGRMTPEQAENHPSRNVISRALGAESQVEIDMKTIMFETGTTFLLCSDGITRHISDVEIRELLALPHPPVVICQEMREICYSRGAEDNLTAVIVRFVGGDSGPELEESTVARAREDVQEPVGFVAAVNSDDEVRTQNLRIPAELSGYADVDVNSPVESETVEIMPKEEDWSEMAAEHDEKTFVIEEGGGFFSKALMFFIGMLVGAAAGIGGYYFWSNMQMVEPPPPAQVKEMQSQNIPFTEFEKARRNVDSNPQKYIDASGATSADAVDFYLIGRAYSLLGKYPEAKDAFGKAKLRLADFKGDAADKTTLANEIAIGLAAIDNGFSRKMLETEKTGAPASNANVGSNVNSAAGNAKSNSNVNANK